jgi:hypothetical protein
VVSIDDQHTSVKQMILFQQSAMAFVLAVLGLSQPPRYHIYGMHFATEPAIPLHYFVPHADTALKLDCADIFWVLEPEGASKRVVLFDAGYYRQKFLDQVKPVPYERPSTAPISSRRRTSGSRKPSTRIISTPKESPEPGGSIAPTPQCWPASGARGE